MPTQKIDNLLRSVKDKVDPLKTPDIYSIPCECGTEYIGMTDRSVATRRKEHSRSIRLNQPDKSAVAEHALNNGHIIEFSKTKVLAKVKGFYNLSRREALEIAQRPNNMNRDNGIGVNKFWSRLMVNKQSSNHEGNRTYLPRLPPPIERDMAEPSELTPPTPIPSTSQGRGLDPGVYNGPVTRSRVRVAFGTPTEGDM